MRSPCSASGTTAGRLSIGTCGDAGSVFPATRCSSTCLRSIATTATTANERFGSGWTSVLYIAGAWPDASSIGIHWPSPSAATLGCGGSNAGGGGSAAAAALGAAVGATLAAVGAAEGTSQYVLGLSS